MTPIEVSAPAKIILFGEHAVVHGQPAIAAPVTSLRASVTAEKAPRGMGLTILVPEVRQTIGVNLSDDTPDNSLAVAARLALRHFGYTHAPDWTLTMRSTVPIGRGFGSGAAVATAIVRALSAALNHPLTTEALNDLIYEVEKSHHGNPSGIDNTVIVYEQPIFFVRGQAIETLRIGQPFTLLIGDTGYATPTYITVKDVGTLYEKEPEMMGAVFNRVGALVRQARAVIEGGNIGVLGPLMNENHTLLQKMTVSSPQLDVLCEAALDAGALGAKLSGGGRGGNMIALVTDSLREKVIQALYAAGASQVTVTRMSAK